MTKKTLTKIIKAYCKRSKDSHKGDYGKIAMISGSTGLTGATCLACIAAMRAGAGLVTAVVPKSLNLIFETKMTEVMTLPIEDNGVGYMSYAGYPAVGEAIAGMDVVGVGPGLGRNSSTAKLVRRLYTACDMPLILDADGLHAFIGQLDVLGEHKNPVIITPHEGEFARLFEGYSLGLRAERMHAAQDVAKTYNSIVVLKGHRTVVASPRGDVYENTTGNPGMATGGSGDVLTGIIAACIGRGLDAYDAACIGVWVHGLAGDRARAVYGETSLIASDIIAALPHVFKILQGTRT